MTAVRKGDPEEASAAMWSHIEASSARLRPMFDQDKTDSSRETPVELLRLGAVGEERPYVRAADGTVHDLSR